MHVHVPIAMDQIRRLIFGKRREPLAICCRPVDPELIIVVDRGSVVIYYSLTTSAPCLETDRFLALAMIRSYSRV
jgi:hypothetical protein